MQIEIRKTEDLIPYENNPRKNDHAVEKVAQAIKEFGFRVPVLIHQDGRIIDGHLRHKAAKAAGIEEVPCLLADDMSDQQIKAFRISINKMAEQADWDMDLLTTELDALQEMDFDLALIGYDEHELDAILGDPGPENDDDKIPEPPANPISCQGDLWQLGDHRLMCGDSTSKDDLKILMGGGTADMVFTDPPYNVDYSGKAGKIKNDKMSAKEFDAFLAATFAAMASVVHPGAPVYVAHADSGLIGIAFRSAFVNARFYLAACLIWKKNQATIGRSYYQWIHEPILYGWKEGAAHKWYGGRKKRTVTEFNSENVSVISGEKIQITLNGEVFTITGKKMEIRSDLPTIIEEKKPLRNADHPTMKPVAMVERFIRNSSKPGDIIMDQFGGSGTTMIAAEKQGRVAMLMELCPRFVDVNITRWQEFTGKMAINVETGQTFAEVTEDRAA